MDGVGEIFDPIYALLLFCGIVIVVIIVALLYSEKREFSVYERESEKLRQLLISGKISEETYERLRMELEKEMTYRKELDHLSSLLAAKKIDQATYERLKNQLEEKYRSEKLSET